jgi:peptidyl-prolyl cis-trans isomerase SurA
MFASVLIACAPLEARSADLTAVAAKVGGDSISVGEVEHEMRVALPDRKVADDEREVLVAQTLGLLVNRQLVIQYLQRTKLGASDADLEKRTEHVLAQLKRQNLALDDQLKQLGITKSEFRRSLAWEIGWPKYLESKLTPENIQKYFEQHRADFDGTKVRVAHLLLKVDMPDELAAVDKVLDRASELREQIQAGKITFAEAARKHSQAPTAAEGGDIGLISRHEPMPEAFSEAAFELKPGETSEPVVTTFGVHLVHCLGIEPGKRTLADDGVEDAVRQDLIRYLFMWISEKQRTESKVEFTGATPYFDTETGKFVPAK